MTRKLMIAPSVLVLVAMILVIGLRGDSSYTVAYASFAPLNSAVYIAEADGRNAHVLVDHYSLDSNASFSSDGQSVLFTSRRSGSADIYRVQLDGKGLTRLTDHPAFDDQAVMAPDGKRIVFVSSRSGQADVWTLELKTKRLRNVTNHPGGDYRPAWSPDGQWIAFTSDRESPGSRANTPRSKGGFAPVQITQLYLVRPD